MAGREIFADIVGRYRGRQNIKQAQRDLKDFGGVGTKTTKALDALGLSAVANGGKFGVAGAAVTAATTALTGAIAVIKQSVTAYTDLVSSVRSFAEASGASAEEASKFIALADDYGISAEQMTKAVGFLAKNLDTSEAKLAEFGVQVAKDAQGNTDLTATLLNVAKAYQATDDPARKAELASTAFGRSYQALIPILNRTSDEIEQAFKDAEKFGQVFDEADFKRAREFELAMDDLGDSAQKLFLTLGEDVVPIITDFANGVVDAKDNVGDFAAKIGDLADNPLGRFIGGIVKLTAALAAFVATPAFLAIAMLVKGLQKLGLFTNEANEAQRDAAKSAKEYKRQVEAQTKAVEDAADAQKDWKKAIFALADATEREAEAEKEYQDFIHKRGKLAEAVASASEDLADADESVADARKAAQQATEELSEAEAELNDKRASEASRVARLIRDAESAKAHAADDLADAKAKQAEAEREVNRVRGDSSATPRQVAKAEEELADATLGVRDANDTVTDAADEMREAQRQQREGTDELKQATERYIAAQENAVEATDSVKDAIKKQAEAQRDLNAAKAAQVDPATQAKLARDLAKAEMEVVDAINAKADAIDRVTEAKAAEAKAFAPPNPFAGVRTTATGRITPRADGSGAPNVASGGTVRDYDGSTIVLNGAVINTDLTPRDVKRKLGDIERLARLTMT